MRSRSPPATRYCRCPHPRSGPFRTTAAPVPATAPRPRRGDVVVALRAGHPTMVLPSGGHGTHRAPSGPLARGDAGRDGRRLLAAEPFLEVVRPGASPGDPGRSRGVGAPHVGLRSGAARGSQARRGPRGRVGGGHLPVDAGGLAHRRLGARGTASMGACRSGHGSMRRHGGLAPLRHPLFPSPTPSRRPRTLPESKDARGRRMRGGAVGGSPFEEASSLQEHKILWTSDLDPLNNGGSAVDPRPRRW